MGDGGVGGPAQDQLETDYKRVLGERHGIVFNRLYTLANMPIQRTRQPSGILTTPANLRWASSTKPP